MKTTYGKIIITVDAEEEDINGPNELELSDEFYYLMEELENHLEDVKGDFPSLSFSIQEE